ncbi:MAG: four helix bundle protein [Lewinellaceae bacterium]|nr:four helix bundle protein [Lewinellaceae bacterium]
MAYLEPPKRRAQRGAKEVTSLLETVNQCILAHDQGFILDEDYLALRAQMEEVGRMISGLRKSIL